MRKYTFILLLVGTATLVRAQTTYFNSDGIAVKGFDVVAYFDDKAAFEGTKQFSCSWEGTTWQFKNESNLNAFKANPAKYAPQFGGWCAYGASRNYKASTDPKAFTIIDGKLYLNNSMKVKEIWQKDTRGYIAKAEANWITLKDQK